MKQESHFNLSHLKVDGGATANGYLMQFQSDILDTEISLPKCLQTTALGAAYLAGLSSGFFTNLDHIKSIHESQKNYRPIMTREEADVRYKGWKKAVEITRLYK